MAPMTRRRSARLASTSQSPVKAAPARLDSLAEDNEDVESSETIESSATLKARPILAFDNAPHTPASSPSPKPSASEMHPGKSHGHKAPPSSALRLGFTDIGASRIESPTTARSNKIAASSITIGQPEETPSKRRSSVPDDSPFTFRFSRGATASAKKPAASIDAGLSDEARRMMEEIRGEAQKIRADLEMERETEQAKADEDRGRKFATPKSITGRFSAAHTAQFDKMDSIANHPSAFRASRFTPVTSTTVPSPAIFSQTRGLKRTQSKANLDDTPNTKLARTPKKTASDDAAPSTAKKQANPVFGLGTASTEFKPPLSVAQRGNLLFPPVQAQQQQQPMSNAKRIKQNIGDDASSGRPMSRDGAGSSLPRPTGLTGSAAALTRSHTTASIVTPTKPTPSRLTDAKTLSTTVREHQTPSKTPSRLLSALKKSVTTSSLKATPGEANKAIRRVPPPNAAVANSGAPPSALPVASIPAINVLTAENTASPHVANRSLPRFPATTPRRRVSKHVSFTPSTQQALLSEKSPSVFRSGIPRSALKSHQQLKALDAEKDGGGGSVPGSILSSPSIRRRFGATVYYPDLSGHELLVGSDQATSDEGSASAEAPTPSKKLAPPTPSAPGTFTFRSDKTISFAPKAPVGFGSSPGQSSIRQVRSSTSAVPKLPGSFPEATAASDEGATALVATDGPNKENTRPAPLGIPHGITNKKRHRISEAEEEAEQEARERAAKKRKNEQVAEGDALLAPRLVGKMMPPVKATPQKASPYKVSAPSSTLGAKTPASAKKRPMISMSRLNSLARPKLRK